MKTAFLKNAFDSAPDYIPDAFERGYHRGLQALRMTELSGRLAIGQSLENPDLKKIVSYIASCERKIDAKAAPEDVQLQMKNILDSSGPRQAFMRAVKNPRAVFNMVAEGMASELPTLVVATASLAAGPVAPAVMGAGITAVSASGSYGQEMLGQFRHHDYDIRDEGSLNAALGNRFMMELARDKALTRASISAAFTMATLGASRAIAGISGVAVRAAEDIGESMLLKTAIRTVSQTVQSLALRQRLPTTGEYLMSQAAGAMNGRMKSFVSYSK